ncbi:MAG: hypothetical protein OCC49_09585, partial [Fibrobacterales bacterium]
MKKTIALLLTLGALSLWFPIIKESLESRHHWSKKLEKRRHKASFAQWRNDFEVAAPGTNIDSIDAALRTERFLGQQPNTSQTPIPAPAPGDHSRIADGMVSGYWVEKGPNSVAGRINGLDKDHTTSTLYATSDGGIVWKKTPTESDWEAL